MRYLFFFLITLITTTPFLSIEWFTIWAWMSLSLILALWYETYYTSQENNYKLTMSVLDKMEKINKECTRMSTILEDMLDKQHPKKKFDSEKFKK